MSRRAAAVLLAFVTVLALCDCDPFNRSSPLTASLPLTFGARVTDGELRIWTGTPCAGVTRFALTFGEAGAPELVLTSALKWGVEVDRITLGGPYPAGLQVATPLPVGFDWRTARSVRLSLNATFMGGGTETALADVVDGSAQHPDDSYFFTGFGWLDAADVAARDGKKFLTPCTPDPAKQPSTPRAFGTRVTDRKLEVWTGSPCSGTDQVILTFQPGEADLVLEPDGSVGQEFERLTLGGPYPGFKVVHPLPDGFDWRSAKSLLLRVHAEQNGFPSATDLSEVLTGSAAHPGDFFFQGVGWLSAADAAAKNTKDFLNTCTRDQ